MTLPLMVKATNNFLKWLGKSLIKKTYFVDMLKCEVFLIYFSPWNSGFYF